MSHAALDKVRSSLAALLFAAGAQVGPAPSPAAAQPLTWEDCLTEAGRGNPDLRAAGYDLESARLQKKAAYSGYFPQISLDAASSRGDSAGNTAFSGPGGSQSGGGSGSASTTNSVALLGSQKLFTGFQTTAEVEQAQANQRTAAAQRDAVKAQVSFDLKSAFAGMVFSREYVELARQIIRRRDENVRMVELRYLSGSENKGSYLLSRASLAEANLNHLQALDLVRLAQQQLTRVLGRTGPADIEVSGKAPVSSPPARVDFERLALAIPEYAQASAQKDAAAAGVKKAQSQFYPSLSLDGELGRRDVSDASADNNWRAGVNLSWPLFSGGKNLYSVRSAKQSVASSLAKRDSVRNQAVVNLQQKFNGFVEAVEVVKVDQHYVEAASARAEIARAKYNNGLISFEDWDIIENDLITRQKNLLQAEHDLVIAEAAWEQAQGKGVLP